jgi:hypothetical protein
MDEATYQAWWVLHLRAARGDRLSPEERAQYEAGLKHLHAQEVLGGDLAELRRARAAVARLEAESAALRARRDALDAEIEGL